MTRSEHLFYEVQLGSRALGTAVVYIQGEPSRLAAMGRKRGVHGEDVEQIAALVDRFVARAEALPVRLDPDPDWLSAAPKGTGVRDPSLIVRAQAFGFALSQAARWIETHKAAPPVQRHRLVRVGYAVLSHLGYLDARAKARVHYGWRH